ncbi:hypothetical protein [Lactococcus lactis]|uniref:hypothetical protein n=1 Tax=Lactococcus lactis TaxID=1358 RepID=UPI0035673F62
MSELYKAMKRIEDYQSTKPLYKQIAEIKGIASTARYGYDIQPQLTIPKSIADEIDCVVNPIGQIVLKSGILSDFTVEAISCIYKNNENGYIAIAYANPLTRDLVKVVEG